MILLIAMPVIGIVRGWGISMLFNWFIAPLGVSEIGWAHAAGLSCLMTVFTTSKIPDEEYGLCELMYGIGFVCLSVVIGWVCHYFMIAS